MNQHIYDEIIIGAGMAGLYWVYKTKPSNFIMLEKSDRIGGRVFNIDWHENQISLGGGVIKKSNVYTICLAKELGFELGESISKYHMIDLVSKISNINIPNEDNFYESNKVIIKYLKKKYNQNKKFIESKKISFEEFLDLYLQLDVSKEIKSYILYQTYWDADVKSVLYDEMDELLRTEDFYIKFIKQKGYTGLLNKLVEIVNKKNILTNQQVIEISKESNNKFRVQTDKKLFCAKKIILATESKTNIKFNISPQINNMLSDLYSMIYGSNYIRIYSYHGEPDGHGLTCSYRTSGLPGKVILINKNILMCCYTEGLEALKLYNLLNKLDKNEQVEIIHKLLTNSNINVPKPDDIIIHFWESGVHYNCPGYSKEEKENLIINLASQNIICIGECVANSHGWVNSAFESVEFILAHI
jgi:hypothetical protein